MFLDLILGVLASLHGTEVVFIFALVVFAAGIGGPWSQDILLLAAARAVAPSDLHPALVIAAGWIGIMAGDAFSLWIGHHYGTRWVRRPWAARFVPPERLPGLEQGMRRVAIPLAFVSRFLPGQRAALYFIFGTLRMPWRAFLVGDGIATAIQASLFFFGARALGWDWAGLRDPFERADNWLTLALVIVLLAWWLRARRAAR